MSERQSSYEAAIASLEALDSEAAKATYQHDKERIDNAIVAAGGFEVIDKAVRSRLLAELLARILERGCDHFELIRRLVGRGRSLGDGGWRVQSGCALDGEQPTPGFVGAQAA